MSSLTPAERDLLAAIREAIDVPRPAEYANEQLFAELQRNRVVSALGTIDAVLADEDCPGCTEAAAQILREQTTKQPVTYRPYEPDRPVGGNLKLPPTQPQVASASASAEAADVR